MAEGERDFGRSVTRIWAILCCGACGLVVANIIRLVSLLIPVSFIVMGSYYKDECSKEYKIPIYLIVMGVANIIAMFNRMLRSRYEDQERPEEPPKLIIIIDAVMSPFLFAWFICGNVWVYKLHYKPEQSKCDTHLYLFAFWSITLTYIFIGIAIVVMCAACCMCTCLSILLDRLDGGTLNSAREPADDDQIP